METETRLKKMHGTIQSTPDSAALAEKMVIDPVCRMTIDPAAAAARELFEGKPVYFCSEGCRHRFLANPAAYTATVAAPEPGGEPQCCSVSAGHDLRRLSPRVLGVAAGAGVLASAILLSLYFGALTLVSGWQYTVEQFGDWWPFIVALATGFGIQVGLFVYLRRALHGAASGKVLVATGTTSGAAMAACCTHYLVNLLPVLGATGLVSFVGAYQVELFWFGIASNLAGIAYIGRRVVSFARGA
jgi:YHS domain-containing protein